MEEKVKPVCSFGKKCYRKNPQHFENYSHPPDLSITSNELLNKKRKLEDDSKIKLDVFSRDKEDRKMKQTTLNFERKMQGSHVKLLEKNSEGKKNNILSQKSSKKNKTSITKTENSIYFRRKNSRHSINKDPTHILNKKDSDTSLKNTNLIEKFKAKKNDTVSDEEKTSQICEAQEKEPTLKKSKCDDKISISPCKDESSDNEDIQSTSWTFIKRGISKNSVENTNLEGFLNKNEKEIIKMLFLFEMPEDFYSFYEFCKTLNDSEPWKALDICDLQLIGPFDILSGVKSYSVEKELVLCHWRFYYDPPEFQTVLTSHSGFHIGYWRDDPKELPVFLASNNPNKNCIFKIESENIFGAVFDYLNEFLRICDPFKKVKIKKLQNALTEWSQKCNFILDKNSKKISDRQKKVVSKTFHKAGIVVPLQPKTLVGYRPLIEKEGNLKKICNTIMQAKDEVQRESLFDNLQPLITAANIANDECDFGNSLELGIDLFCMGSPVFHETAEHLLTTAYFLLNRNEFADIIKAHLKNRRKGNNLSVF